MSGFYFSFEFRSKDNITYFLPLKLKTQDKEVAERYYNAMKTAISENYEIVNTELPMIILFHIDSKYVNKMMSRPFKGKLVNLKVREWEFIDFNPSLELSFSENFDNASKERIEEIDWLGLDLNNKSLVKLIHEYRFPVQVISNPYFNDETNLLVIQLVSAGQ